MCYTPIKCVTVHNLKPENRDTSRFDGLAAHFLENSDFSEAEKIARQALLVDDLFEPAHQYLMKALAGSGEVAG